jgi:hypothetical protein
MKSWQKIAVGLSAAYLSLWALTWFISAPALERQYRSIAAEDWKVTVTPKMTPGPFIFNAKCDFVLNSHEGHGDEGWYFWTPWKVYTIKSSYVWIS